MTLASTCLDRCIDTVKSLRASAESLATHVLGVGCDVGLVAAVVIIAVVRSLRATLLPISSMPSALCICLSRLVAFA